MKHKTKKFAAFVGLDWADKKHDVSIWAPDSAPVHHEIQNTPESLNDWLQSLRKQYPDGQIALCFEGSKSGLLFHLMGYDFVTIFQVNPKSMARFREAFTPSGAKGDQSDADFLREIVVNYHESLSPWEPDDEQTRMIALLAIDRRKAVEERTRLTNRLLANLKMYFPQAIKLAGETLYSPLAIDFFHKWPQLADIQKSKEATVRKFYLSHNSRSKTLIEERVSLVRSTIPITKDQAIIKSSILKTQMIVGQLAQLSKAIILYEAELENMYKHHPDKDIFDSFPGAGPALGPRLLAAWGSNRKRFDSAQSMQKFSGIAPIIIASGNSKRVLRRLACPKFILQTFHEFANCSRASSSWAEAYYKMQCKHGKSHHIAIRALAFKWIRIMFKCWQNKTKYNEAVYLKQLIKTKSPMLEFL